MNILIDIVHPADINFYKQAVAQLSKQHTIIFTVMNRGRVPAIVAKEFKGYEQIVFGKHRTSFLGKLLTIAIREFKFLQIYSTRDIDVVSSFGFYPGFLAPLFGIKAVQFHDDKEYAFNYNLSKRFSSRFISLCDTKETKKTKVAHTYKELAYLHTLKADDAILKKLHLKKNKYVYVREVADVSLNYKSETFYNYQKTFDELIKKGYAIIYDGEANTNPYKNVIEFKGIFSSAEMIAIKKHAALIITSGDTVLREGALLGTPTIYTSSRVMNVNQSLQNQELFEICLDEKSLLSTSKKIISKKPQYQKLAKEIISSCEDMTQIIIDEVGLQ